MWRFVCESTCNAFVHSVLRRIQRRDEEARAFARKDEGAPARQSTVRMILMIPMILMIFMIPMILMILMIENYFNDSNDSNDFNDSNDSNDFHDSNVFNDSNGGWKTGSACAGIVRREVSLRLFSDSGNSPQVSSARASDATRLALAPQLLSEVEAFFPPHPSEST